MTDVQLRDLSAYMLGKYQHCTMHSDGLYYADSDFRNGFGGGGLVPGALPAPNQWDTENTLRATAMHERAAEKAVRRQMKKIQRRPGFWRSVANVIFAHLNPRSPN